MTAQYSMKVNRGSNESLIVIAVDWLSNSDTVVSATWEQMFAAGSITDKGSYVNGSNMTVRDPETDTDTVYAAGRVCVLWVDTSNAVRGECYTYKLTITGNEVDSNVSPAQQRTVVVLINVTIN